MSLGFFYGTVMRGQPNHGNLEGAVFRREAETAPSYRLLSVDDAYPALAEGGSSSIAGELYDLGEEIWARVRALDPPWMLRKTIGLANGTRAESMIATPEPPPGITLKDISEYGGWRRYLATKV